MLAVKKEVKRECCCCFSNGVLHNMLEYEKYGNRYQNHIITVAECFQVHLEVNTECENKVIFMICQYCKNLLHDAANFRSRIRIAYTYRESYNENLIDEYSKFYTYGTESTDNALINEEFVLHCCCCDLNDDNLFSMLEPYVYEGKTEIYATMIAECFNIELTRMKDGDENFYMICANCVNCLRKSINLRTQIKTAFSNETAVLCDNVVVKKENNLVKEEMEIDIDDIKVKNEYDNDGTVSESNFSSSVPNLNDKQNEISNLVADKTTIMDKSDVDQDPDKSTGSIYFLGAKIESILNAIHSKEGIVSQTLTPDSGVNNNKNEKMNKINKIASLRRRAELSCYICDCVFSANYLLVRHIRSHFVIAMMKCKICKQLFSSESEFDEHLMSHDAFICDSCEETFESKTLLVDHTSSKHRKT